MPGAGGWEEAKRPSVLTPDHRSTPGPAFWGQTISVVFFYKFWNIPSLTLLFFHCCNSYVHLWSACCVLRALPPSLLGGSLQDGSSASAKLVNKRRPSPFPAVLMGLPRGQTLVGPIGPRSPGAQTSLLGPGQWSAPDQCPETGKLSGNMCEGKNE